MMICGWGGRKDEYVLLTLAPSVHKHIKKLCDDE